MIPSIMWHIENAHRWNDIHVTANKHVGRQTSTMARSTVMRADLPRFNPGSTIYNFCDFRQAK